MSPIDFAFQSLVLVGILCAIILGMVASVRRRAVWIVASSVSLLFGSIPLLLGGTGVFGIAGAVILLVVARAVPGYHLVRWWAIAFAVLCLATVLALQLSGALLGNRPSLVDWILLALASVMFIITAAPMRGRPRPILPHE